MFQYHCNNKKNHAWLWLHQTYLDNITIDFTRCKDNLPIYNLSLAFLCYFLDGILSLLLHMLLLTTMKDFYYNFVLLYV